MYTKEAISKKENNGKHRTALVLEGGAMRGIFSAGVIDVLMENNIHFDAVIGVSAGAAFGCNYKSHQPGRVIRYNRRFAKKSVRGGVLLPYLTEGIGCDG